MSPRRLCYQVATSLDGYIAGPRGEFDWIATDPDIDFKAMFERYGALLMGRRTWEVAVGQRSSGTFYGMPAIVVSKTLDPAAHRGITVISQDVEARVRELKEQPGKDIWLFGGGALFSSLLEAGLVDSVELAVIPVLLGGGIPFLPAVPHRHPLRLKEHRLFPKTGTLLLTYEVLPPGERAAPSRKRPRKA